MFSIKSTLRLPSRLHALLSILDSYLAYSVIVEDREFYCANLTRASGDGCLVVSTEADFLIYFMLFWVDDQSSV
uniref:Uncharacterized protein n=1 Tax=Anguilla anguilla TaxID=7936 RepID=A0A0E9WIQ5_ANGAN